MLKLNYNEYKTCILYMGLNFPLFRPCVLLSSDGMNMNENCMDYIHLTDDKLLGFYPWKGGLNLLNIVLIGIADEVHERDEKYALYRLLGILLSAELTAVEKLEVMEKEYHIPVDDKMREDVNTMCNLSLGILERGKAKGEAGIILNLYKNGYAVEEIAKAVDEVQKIIETGGPVLK